MRPLDWLLFCLPVAFVVLVALRAQRYVRGVADFLSAGRIARRYVLCVASGEANFGLITLVGSLEAYYNSGFAYNFWGSVLAPVGMVLGLVGFCNYRFRETRAMTLGQFFEMRYNRQFRLAASVVQAFYGVLNYAIFPAVGARFLMYFLRLPVSFRLFGLECSTFAAVMLAALALACFIACAGGQITIMATDCVQGILNYPIYLVVVACLLLRFSWGGDLLPALSARPAGASFLDPFDTGSLRDFNVFYVVSGLLGTFLLRLSWGSRGYDSAAKDAHEAKMGAVLGTWRVGFGAMMFVLLAAVAYAFHNHPRFARESAAVRSDLAAKAWEDVAFLAPGGVPAGETEAVRAALAAVEPRSAFTTREGYAALGSAEAQSARFAEETADPYLAAVSDALGGRLSEGEIAALPESERKAWGARRSRNQVFGTVYAQQRVLATIRAVLPTGVVGLFCALALFMMLTTDTTYLHGWASVIVQDILLPLRKSPWEPRRQIRALRFAIVGVAAFAFVFSCFFGQVDYILMFFAVTGALWMASGPVITLGLYWRRGTSAGAFAALFFGVTTALAAIFAQKFWVSGLYPWIVRHGWAAGADALLRALSAPFEPWIHWELTADKFPVNSAEVGVITQLLTLAIYWAVSLATCRKPFDLAKMLHRDGTGDLGGASSPGEPLFSRLLGIDAHYTRADKALAWSVFLYSFVFWFCVCFLGNVLWHVGGVRGWWQPQRAEWWGRYFYLTNLVIPFVVGAVSTVWFGFCSTRDLLRLFRDLACRDADGTGPDVEDDGRVESDE